jgi:tRNA wybutosine-synthesizing protein 4
MKVPRVECPTLEQFLNEIYAKRKPVILKNCDMGKCSQLWTPEYIKEVCFSYSSFIDSLKKCGEKEVSVHSCGHKLMDFLNKNYTFESMKISNLVDKMYQVRFITSR